MTDGDNRKSVCSFGRFPYSGAEGPTREWPLYPPFESVTRKRERLVKIRLMRDQLGLRMIT